MYWDKWLARYERMRSKHRKAVIKRNVRAYRARQAKAGIVRIDVALTREHRAALEALRLPGETWGATVGRIAMTVSGNLQALP